MRWWDGKGWTQQTRPRVSATSGEERGEGGLTPRTQDATAIREIGRRDGAVLRPQSRVGAASYNAALRRRVAAAEPAEGVASTASSSAGVVVPGPAAEDGRALLTGIGTAEDKPAGTRAYMAEGTEPWGGERWAQETRGPDASPAAVIAGDGAHGRRAVQEMAIPERLAPQVGTTQVQAEVPPPDRESAVAHLGQAEAPQAIVTRGSSRAKLVAGGLVLLLGGGAAAALVIASQQHGHTAPRGRSAAAATRAPTPAHGQPAQTPRRQRLVQQLEIAIIDDVTQKAQQGSGGKAQGASTTCVPAAGSAAQNATTTTYSCIAFVHASSSDSGSRYRYAGTVDFHSGTIAWHFVGAT